MIIVCLSINTFNSIGIKTNFSYLENWMTPGFAFVRSVGRQERKGEVAQFGQVS
jgi:hypothetical protein